MGLESDSLSRQITGFYDNSLATINQDYRDILSMIFDKQASGHMFFLKEDMAG